MKAGIKHGIGRMVFANGHNYKGEFLNGMMSFGIYNTITNSYSGHFKDNQLHGQGSYVNKLTGEIFTGNFNMGVLEGYGEWIHFEKKYKGLWVKGVRHGVGKFIKGDREVQVQYVNGKLKA